MATLRNCGVIRAVKPGGYAVVKHGIENKEIIRLLVYAIMHCDDRLYYNFSGITRFKELFPFDYDISITDIDRDDFFSIDRIGGEIVVMER